MTETVHEAAQGASEVVLLMETRERGAGWARLYRTGAGYLDLCCRAEAAGRRLEGRLWLEPGCESARVTVALGGSPRALRLAQDGAFSLQLPQGSAVELHLQTAGGAAATLALAA